MGCDIHLKLERREHGVDDATKAARYTLLMIAKRATMQHEEAPQSAFLRMPPELWQRCAMLVPVTGVDKWHGCDFWLYNDEKSFVKMRREFIEKLDLTRQDHWSTLFQLYEDDHGPFEDEQKKQMFIYQNEYEVEQEVMESMMESVSGFWSDDISDLCGRHYNRFGLFGNINRASLPIRHLGCVRLGWPADVNEMDAQDVTDPNLHSHCFVTLAGLFAVDWDVAVSSTARSGRALRPSGPFVGTPYQHLKQRYAMQLGLIKDIDGMDQEPSLANSSFKLDRLFTDVPLASPSLRYVMGLSTYPPGWDDMSEKEKCEAALERLMKKMVAEGRVPADDDHDGGVEEVETADAGSSADEGTTRREVMGDDLCAGLVKMKARMAENGASPDDFRVLICYDN